MKREDILTQCLDDIEAGRSTAEECLTRYPELAVELRPLLEIALKLKPPQMTATPEFRARARQHLIEVMRLDEPQGGKPFAPRRVHVFPVRLATSLIAGLLVAAIAGGTTVYASRGSLPGDALYPVKTGVETIQVALTFGQDAKASRQLGIAQRRVDEMADEVRSRGHLSPSAAGRVAAQLDVAVEAIGKAKPEAAKELMSQLAESGLHNELVLDELAAAVPESAQTALQETVSAVRRGKLIAEVSYENPEFLGSQPSVNDRELEQGKFKLSGLLTSVDTDTWKIDGVTLRQVRYKGTPPPPNSWVRVEGLNSKGRVFITRVQLEDSPKGEVSVVGLFKGTSEDGKVWNVGGISVQVAGGSPPQEGDELRIEGTSQEGGLNVSGAESRQAEDIGIEIDGTLSAVDAAGYSILVKRAGTLFKVNVNGASIRTEERRSLSVSDLGRYIERQIEVEGLYKKDGTLYARVVTVEDGHDHDSGEGSGGD